MVPGHVPLLTHSKTRSLLASIGNEPVASQFIELRIPPAPRKDDETWSDWIFATQRADLSPVSDLSEWGSAIECVPLTIDSVAGALRPPYPSHETISYR